MSLAIVETSMTIKVLYLYIMGNNNNINLASTVGQKWTQPERDLWTIAFIPIIYLGVFVGLVLSDAHLRKAGSRINACLEFGQSLKHKDFFLFIFGFLAPFLSIKLPH